MSDIHGCLDAFKASLSTIDLEARDSKLVLLGDYCDRGPDSLGVFELVMDLKNVTAIASWRCVATTRRCSSSISTR